MTITKEDIAKIMAALSEAYKAAGKEIKTAVLLEGDKDPEILVDTRDDEDIN